MESKKRYGTRTILTVFYCVIFVMSATIYSWASEKVVKVVTLTDYPPYCFDIGSADKLMEETIAPNGDSKKLQGYSWDVVRESFHQMGYTINLQVMPWARAMKFVEKGRVDVIFPAGMTEDRKKIFDYSQEFINNVNFLIYVPVNVDFKFNGLGSLSGLKIGTMREWNFGQDWTLDDKINKIPVDDIIQAFKMLQMKRVDGVVGYDIIFDYTLKKEGLSQKFKKMSPFDSSKEYLIGSKTNQKVHNILKAFDEGKLRIVSSGTMEEINKKWQ